MTQIPQLVKEISAELVDATTPIPDSIKALALELGFNIEIDSSKCVIGQDAKGNTIFEEAMVITREIPDDLTIKDFEGAVMQFIQMNTGSKVNLPFENSLIKVRSKSSVWNMDGFLIESKASGKLFRVKTRIPNAVPFTGEAYDQDQSFISYTLQIASAARDLVNKLDEYNVLMPEVYAAGRDFMISEVVPQGKLLPDNDDIVAFAWNLNKVMSEYIMEKRAADPEGLWKNIFPIVWTFFPIPLIARSNFVVSPDGKIHVQEPFFYVGDGIKMDQDIKQELMNNAVNGDFRE